MMTLLLILAIITAAIGWHICVKFVSEGGGIVAGISGVLIIMFAVLTVGFADEAGSCSRIDDKLAMYQEENAKIEEQIDALVQNYMKYETDTFSEFKGEDSMTLVSLYPELKSDELVQNQMSIYAENNKKIKELKEQKIDASRSKWWLYFGK